jgi:serine/threonine-protein kinase
VETLVVIKRLAKALAKESRLSEELLEEARIAGQLAHLNIAQIFDVGEDDSGYYFAMEHVHGKSLRSVLRALDDTGAVLPVEHALHIAIQLCTALAHAHDHKDVRGKRVSVVHGAISPDNVFVTFAGDVKVTDFGFLESKKWLMNPEIIAYPAPEQMRGEPADARTDLFALGMLLLELTTGKAPHHRPPDFAPGYPPKLAALLLQAAARRRMHRPQSASELLAQLEAFAKKGGIRISPAAFAHFLRNLFPDAEAQIVRERREAKLASVPRDEAETLPDTREPATTADELTLEMLAKAPRPVLPRMSTEAVSGMIPELETELRSAGLRPMPTAPPSARTMHPQVESSQFAVVGTAFIVGMVVGVFGASLGLGPSPAVATVSASSPSVPAAAPSDVSSSLPAARDLGSLEVQSEPSGANIFLEGDLLPDVTPATLRKLPFGRPLSLRLSHAGFEPYRAEVTLSPQRPRDRVAARLSPATFTLQLTIDAPDTALWIDGKFTPSRTIPGLAVDQDHKIAVSAPGRIGKIVMFRSEQGGEKHIDLKLDPVRNSR